MDGGTVSNSTAASSSSSAYFSLTVAEWAALLVGVVVLWVAVAVFLALCCGPDFVVCYLCEQQIPRSFWGSGEHRAECAKAHEKFFEQLPTHQPTRIRRSFSSSSGDIQTRCPVCYRPLRVWPGDRGPREFTCMSGFRCVQIDSTGHKRPCVNDGTNRLNCFNCDFDVCRRCANGEFGVANASNSVDSGGNPAANQAWFESVGRAAVRNNKIMSVSQSVTSNLQRQTSFPVKIRRP